MREFLPDGCEFQLTICPAAVTASIHDYTNHVTDYVMEGIGASFLEVDDPSDAATMVDKSSILEMLNEVRSDHGLGPI
jgi:hypothetical protein